MLYAKSAVDQDHSSKGLSRRRLLIGGTASLGAAAAAAASFAWPKGQGPAPPPRTVAILVDVTDPLSPGQNQALSTTLRASLNQLSTGSTVGLYLIMPSEQGPLKRLVEERKPKPPSLASAVFENRRFLRTDYDAFTERFWQRLDMAAQVKTSSPTSPIVEALWTLAQKGRVHEIELWSDMVNNASTSVDHFRPGYRFDEATRRKLPFTGLDNLRGAKVRIYQLAINTRYQTRNLERWWQAYWCHVGAEIASWTLVLA